MRIVISMLTLALAAGGLAAPPAGTASFGRDRTRLIAALGAGKVTDPERKLVHASHVCTLRIAGRDYPVADVRELVPGASSPHGVNQIVVLNTALRVQRAYRYVDQRPLGCSANRLLLSGALAVEQVEPEGNVLVFSSPTERPQATTVELNSWP